MDNLDYDYVIIGSGFGGSVSALRLAQKGYKVLVIEKGKWFAPDDFPKTNWNLPKWMWLPSLKLHGLFRLTYFRHVAILSGVGVGGGSLVYANTLPVPKTEFFNTGSWAKLMDWETELKPYYPLALKMLGAEKSPYMRKGDRIMKDLAAEIGKSDKFDTTNVAVYFGKPEITVPDPYFDGEGPDRTGCIQCGACMLGCRYNSKNTLDKNYLYLAQKLGVKIIAESEVYDVVPNGADGNNGYTIKYRDSLSWFPKKGTITSKGVIFSGGVLGTVKLLLSLKRKSLPNLSEKVGYGIRTNSEALFGVTSLTRDKSYSEGIAIGSILHTDDHSHIEVVRYAAGSGFFRMFMAPMVAGKTIFSRFLKMVKDAIVHPISNFKVLFTDDWSKRTIVLLFMQSIDSTLRFKKGLFGLSTNLDKGPAPTSFIPEAQDLATRYGKLMNGKPMVMNTESLFGIPTTAHILGGACMGNDESEGVIDKNNMVFGYKNMMVCDGSMISANPGVNPSLSITAISELAMSKIAAKNEKMK